jgi:hypothetical protein
VEVIHEGPHSTEGNGKTILEELTTADLVLPLNQGLPRCARVENSCSLNVSVSACPASLESSSSDNNQRININLGHGFAVKRGFRASCDPKICGVSFENLPVWLWAIRPIDWSQIFITKRDESRLCQTHPELWNRLSDKFLIVSKSVMVDSQVSLADVWWVSGSASFINGLSFPQAMRLVIWVEGRGRRLTASLSQSQNHIHWTNINHCRVGGVTNARGWFGARGLNKIVIPWDLHRTLAHVLKHSIRGKPCSADPSDRHYTPDDRLSINLIDQIIVYPSFLSHTGWVKRPLDPVELAMSFELPEYVPWNSSLAHSIVPLQHFRTVIDHILGQLGPPSPPVCRQKMSCGNKPCEEVQLAEDGIWLPSINKWLSGSWADVDISSQAVKSDDAVVDCRPWHLRISLALPCQPRTLEVMARLAMRRWRFNIVTSFFSYLNHQYGSEWKSQFLEHYVSRPGRVGIKRRHHDSAHVLCGAMIGASGGGIEPSISDDGSTLFEREGGSAKIATSFRGGDGQLEHLLDDVPKGLLVIGQVLQSTWWEWNKGSSLLFWRWNGLEQIRAARDGMPIFVQSSLPRSSRKVKKPKFSDNDRPLVAAKIKIMIEKGYLELGKVRTSLHYFAVPKGADDIRIVYDGTSCGLNESLWSPNFFLPTARTAELLLSFGSWMADVDFGEFFHNFYMDERIRQHSGVNVKPLLTFIDPAAHVDNQGSRQLRWSRLFMGMKSSPYNAVRHYYWGEEFARGDTSDTLTNPFGYDQVILNLPGSEGYTPTAPKIYKWNSRRQCIPGDVVAFVDDVRITASSKESCHDVHRQFTSRMQYLGFQDAPRKFRPPSQSNAGAWTGTIFSVGRSVISKTVSQEKWIKGRTMITDLNMMCCQVDGARPVMNRKQLERSTGFLNHLSTTFDVMTPYLKGFYLTLNSWRSKRNNEDWKVSDKMWLQLLLGQLEDGLISNEEFDSVMNEHVTDAPTEVVASPRFAKDVGALMEMFKAEVPPVVGLRSKHIVTVVYGFGDASGTGLGATFTCGTGLTFRIGVWGTTESDQSSNWREFANVVDSLEEEARSGNLEDSEVFMFTDNSTVESCAVKGSSSSEKLFELVVRLRCLTTEFGIKLHIFHVAGTRMIAQGTDGVSRGFLGAGVMLGESMTSFIPIHLSALERSETLKDWVLDWTNERSNAIFLSPKDWFNVAHDINGWKAGWDGFPRPVLSKGSVIVWSPPPFVADVALTELRKARIKRQLSSHIFICPRLCTSLWIRQLFKASDIVLEIPPGKSFWPSNMHEPLLIGILFPFIRCYPWQLRSTPRMFAMAREVRSMQDGTEVDLRDLLFKFWVQCHRIGHMPTDVVRRMLFLGSRS